MTDVRAELLPCPTCNAPEQSVVDCLNPDCGLGKYRYAITYPDPITRPQPSPKVDGLVERLTFERDTCGRHSSEGYGLTGIKRLQDLLTEAIAALKAVQP